MAIEEPEEKKPGLLDFLCNCFNWSAAVDEEHCDKIAERTGKTLDRVIETEQEILKVICVWKEEE